MIFSHESDSGSKGELGIDEHGALYWNGKPVVTEQKVTLQWWVNLSAILAALSTVVIAILATITYFSDMQLKDKYIQTVTIHEKIIVLYKKEIKSLKEQASQYKLFIEEAKESIKNKTHNKSLNQIGAKDAPPG